MSLPSFQFSRTLIHGQGNSRELPNRHFLAYRFHKILENCSKWEVRAEFFLMNKRNFSSADSHWLVINLLWKFSWMVQSLLLQCEGHWRLSSYNPRSFRPKPHCLCQLFLISLLFTHFPSFPFIIFVHQALFSLIFLEKLLKLSAARHKSFLL